MGGVTTMDTKFHEVIIQPRDASCRACENFIRVRHNARNAHHMRGFCKLGGNGDGEFNLYQSSSESHSCGALVIDDYALETKKMEDELQSEILNLREKIHNKRTKEYKLFRDFFDKSKEMMCGKERACWEGSILGEFLEEGAIFYEWYYSLNVDRFQALYKRKAMNKSQYAILMTNIIQSINKNLNLTEQGEAL